MQSQHQAILQAVRDGNVRDAEARARDHIHDIRDAITEALGSESGAVSR